jgi:hypothetical protein
LATTANRSADLHEFLAAILPEFVASCFNSKWCWMEKRPEFDNIHLGFVHM